MSLLGLSVPGPVEQGQNQTEGYYIHDRAADQEQDVAEPVAGNHLNQADGQNPEQGLSGPAWDKAAPEKPVQPHNLRNHVRTSYLYYTISRIKSK